MNEESQPVFASEEMRERVADLIERERDGEISTVEKSELDYYLQLEHQMRLEKARTHEYLKD